MQPQNSQSSVYPLPPKGPRFSVATIVMAALFVLAAGFGTWAFMNGQTYKNNADQKSAAAAAAAVKTEDAKLQAQFAAQNKLPYKTFTGSPTYGSITFSYPKSWSGYVDTTNQSEPINGYFHPDVVPSAQSTTAYALRVELLASDYAGVVGNYTQLINNGSVKASAYMPPKMQGVANAQPGMLMSGQVTSDSTEQGTMVVIKVRDKTLKIYTESNDFASDFNNVVLPSLVFAP